MLRAVPPLTSRIHVVFLYVKDLERAAAFYRDVFGLTLEGDGGWREAQLGGTRFALHSSHDGAPEPSSGGIVVDFEVDDIDSAVQRLRDARVQVGEISRQPYGTFCDFTDPEGYTLQLFQRAS